MVFSYKSGFVLKVGIYIALLLLIYQIFGTAMGDHHEQLYSCNFEVFGRVQGVFFRKYTEKQANYLGVRGWCRNTDQNTVVGQLEAPLFQLNEMKKWLTEKGSPSSKIERVEFSENKEISHYTFNGFDIRP